MVRIVKLTEENFQETLGLAKEVVESGGLIIYPTDTLYGIGGDALSGEVVAKINNAKQISEHKPLSVMMADINMVKRFCDLSKKNEKILKQKLPGPFTFLLKLRKNRPLPVTNNEKLGIRIPDNEFCIKLSRICNRPIITTSANRTGNPPSHKLSEVDSKVLEAADLGIDGGETKYKHGSEVVDLVDKKVIRNGPKS